MAYPRDGQPLLGGGGGEQSSGAAEQDALQLTFVQLVQQMPAEGNGAAAAAGASGVDILNRIVEDHAAAVGKLPAQKKALPFTHFQQHFFPKLPQIAGDDQVEILRDPMEVLHVGSDCTEGCWRHCCTHIVGIGDPQIRDGADGAAFDSWPCSRGADKCCPGAGDGPLGGGGPLTAVAQRKTVLPFRGCEMGGSLGHHFVRKAAAYYHGGNQQAFRHGGAGPVKPQMGDILIAKTKRRTDALVQQISGQYQVKVRCLHVCLFCQFLKSHLLALLFRLLPGLLAEFGILGGNIKGMGQRPFRFLLPGDAGPGPDHRQLGQGKALLSAFLTCQNNTLFVGFP